MLFRANLNDLNVKPRGQRSASMTKWSLFCEINLNLQAVTTTATVASVTVRAVQQIYSKKKKKIISWRF